MKKILLTICICMCFAAGAAQAGTVTLKWDAASKPVDFPASTIIKYRIFHKLGQAAAFNFAAPVYEGTATTCTVPSQVGENFYAARTVFTSWVDGILIQSANSNVVKHTVQPGPLPEPQNLLLEAIDQIIEGMRDLRQWAVENKIGAGG
ncbi:MAG TPA: hypothetical protein VJ019_05465 [Aestuariivirga sp.]|nr:hypothetical protein [Aestuariivirga sp.]